MEIIKITNTKKYIKFISGLYKNNAFYKDNKSDLINMICDENSPFKQNSKQEMIGVLSDNKIQCESIFISHKNLPDTLMIAFFEANKNKLEEVNYLIDYAKTKAQKWNCQKIVVAINGHCNYSLGLLNNNFDESADFSESYNPQYYADYFKNKFKVHNFYSYKNNLPFIGEQIVKLKTKLDKQNIEFKKYDSHSTDFKQGIQTYTKLNNEIFSNHLYYYKREYNEDLELFVSMKPLLTDKNLIIAYKDKEPIGFLFWYPDFNELVPAREKVNLFSILKYRLFKQKPKQIMLTEIGVLPKYEKSGLIISLFLELYNYLHNEYDKNCIVHSGWIYNKNLKSKNLVQHILQEKSKEFCIYELAL